MQVETKTMGTVTVDENQIVTFPNGLYGFEEYHRYAIIEAEYQPFYWLQSLDEKNLAFIIVDPFLLVSDYELDIDDRTLCEIGIDSPGDVILFAIITIPARSTWSRFALPVTSWPAGNIRRTSVIW